MDFWTVLIIFFSGVFAHMFALRIFRVWSKSLMYRATFLRCLDALQMTDEMSQNLLKTASPESIEQIEVAFNYWRTISLYSLQGAVKDAAWKNIAITDWKTAMSVLKEVKRRTDV